MKVYYPRNRIQFDIPCSDPDIEDKFTFIVLTSAKFDGEISKISKFWDVKGPGNRGMDYSIEIKFPEYTNWLDAKTHCRRELIDDGRVRSDYRGALDAVGPKRRVTNELLERAKTIADPN